jgi:ATP-dependent Clp protease ATP-binding subunit ClpC
MSFLDWHYSHGIRFYVKRYSYTINWVVHYFSLQLLLPTLFSPWKRLIEVDRKSGFSFERWFKVFTFNLVSRFMGAIIRLLLFIVGIYVLVFVFIFGAIGMVVWVLIPPLSYSLYKKYLRSPQQVSHDLVEQINDHPDQALSIIFSSRPGKFTLEHLGVSREELLAKSEEKIKSLKKVNNFHKLVQEVVKSGSLDEENLNSHGIKFNDLEEAASWWDAVAAEESAVEENPPFGRAGIGAELLYGYTPNLTDYSTDLSAPQSFSHHLIGRHNLVSRMERVLSSEKNIFLIGPPGVGKKTVVLEFANRAATGQLGSKMAYNKVLELNHNVLISESSDVNQKKLKLMQILAEAANAGNIILMIKDMHRLTNPAVEGFDFTDVFEQFLEQRKIKIIGILTEHEYERFMAPNLRLRKFFESIEVKQPSREEALQIIFEAAKRWEATKGIITTVPAVRQILDGSERYITEIPFPEKALELLDSAVTYCLKNNKQVVDPDLVRDVLAEKTGISLARLTEREKNKLTNLEEIIHKRLVNQETAVNLIAQILRSKTTGVVDSRRPLGSFIFLGPTGVGKTETAKVLAKVYFGSEANILRFDMAEYAGQEGLERLIGSLDNNQPGVMTTEIRNRPASLLLLDEIEKAPPQIFNLFLSMLDEGKITDAFGRQVNCSHLFIVATSNAGAEFIRTIVEQGVKGGQLQKQVMNRVMEERIFSPEFINRFDGAIVYEPLTKDNLLKIADYQLSELKHNLKEKNIFVDFDQSVVEKVVADGYDPAFGARPMRRVIELQLGDMIGRGILSGEIKEGKKVNISCQEGKFIVKTN